MAAATRRKVAIATDDATQPQLPTLEDVIPMEVVEDEVEPEFYEDEEPLIDITEVPDEEDDVVPPASVEDMDPNERLWDDGPTAGHIVKWKAAVGDVFVTQMSFNTFAVWRTLNRIEYRGLNKALEAAISSGKSQSDAQFDYEEMVTELCILWPRLTRQDFAEKSAGLPSLLSQQILEASGFTSIDVRQL